MTDAPDEALLADLVREAVMLFSAQAVQFLLPVLLVAVLVGLVQTVFSIQESSLSFLPKLAALVAVMAIAGDATMAALADFLRSGLADMVGTLR
ncbi:MAG: flagellar biosynthetic protein FliQ [Sphingomonadales bacterium]|jgi:flagellar biosynthetic protein FliQ